MTTEIRQTPAQKMAAYRARMRAKGYKLVQMWVPDTSSQEFQAEARRQSLLLKNDPHEQEIMDWAEKLMEDEDFGEWKE